MRRIHIVLGIVLIVVVLQAVGMVLLGLLIYQATPNSVLARQTFIGRIPGVLATVRLLDHSTNFLYRGPRPPEALPQYQLRIDPADQRAIEEALPTELPSPWYDNLFLTDDAKDWTNATFIADREEYDVKIRVRGDIFNHWAYRKKSWRVKFQSGHLFRGMREINLIIPEDRGWIAEAMDVFRATKFGLLHPPMRFVAVSVNGSGPLLYTEIEHWTKEMLEKQARPGDANIYQTGGGESYFQQWNPGFDEIAYWQKYIENPSAPEHYEEIAELLKLSEEGAHNDPRYVERLSTIVQLDKLVSWYALSLLAGSRHVSDFNVRLYFDPSKGQFEPIPWDTSLYNPRTLLSLPGNKFLNEVFRVPELRLAVHRTVWDYIQDDNEVQEDLDEAARLRALIERAAYRDPLKLMSNRQVKSELDLRQRQVQSNIDFLKNELEISEVLTTQRIPSNADRQRNVVATLDFIARGVAVAELHEVSLPEALRDAIGAGRIQLWRDDGDGVYGSADFLIPTILRDEADKNGRAVLQVTDDVAALLWTDDPELNADDQVIGAPHTHHRFFLISATTDLNTSDFPLNLDLRNAVTGERIDPVGEVVVDGRTFERLDEATVDRAAFLRRYPFFAAQGENGIVLRGAHAISSTIIVPSTVQLTLDPGTTLRMRPGVSILSYAPVTMVGTQAAPITITADSPQEPWGVFAVLHAAGPSTIRWVNASYGGEATINGAFFSGMLAFHASPVSVSDSTFRFATGDDGLNIKYVPVAIARSRFERNAFDGLDIDVAPEGTVEDSVFSQNGNDGIDLSWSPITIRTVQSIGNGDKCISVGESSHLLIQDSLLSGCHYGVAVKDGSEALLENVIFENNDIAVSSYIKKSIFSAPTVTVRGSTFTGNAVQQEALSGATITIEQ